MVATLAQQLGEKRGPWWLESEGSHFFEVKKEIEIDRSFVMFVLLCYGTISNVNLRFAPLCGPVRDTQRTR